MHVFIVRTVVVCPGLPLLLPHPGRGPAQSAERVWPKRGSEAKGRSLSASLREGARVSKERTREKRRLRKKVEFVENSRVRGVLRVASKRANEGFVKRFSVSKQSL